MIQTTLFYNDPYLFSFDAVVEKCIPQKEGYAITLSNTAFYPEGGGQPYDLGVLITGDNNVIPVTAVYEKSGGILHTVSTPVDVGTGVKGEINKDRRLALMQLHTGEHIISGIIHRLYGFDNVGFHISQFPSCKKPDADFFCTIDTSGPLDSNMLLEVEEAANRVIWSNLPVSTRFFTEDEAASREYRSKKELEGTIRLVEINDVDACACCGLHTRTTGEVGIIKILDSQVYKKGNRITLTCGMSALWEYRRRSDNLLTISRSLSAKPHEVVDAFERLEESKKALQYDIFGCEERLIDLLIASAKDKNAECVMFSIDNASTELIRRLALKACDCFKLCVAVAPAEGGSRLAVASNNEDLKAISTAINSKGGRCGGKPPIIQGMISVEPSAVGEIFTGLGYSIYTTKI